MFNNKGVNTSFVSKKELPWHMLGKIVDTMTSKEAIVLGGLDFEVEKVPLWIKNTTPITFDEGRGHENLMRIKEGENNPQYYSMNNVVDKFAMIRTDTQHYFGTVGSRYEPLQNIEAFEWFDSFIGENNTQYETVGALGNGETVFITVKLPDYFEVAKSQIDKYLLLSMSHDGSSSIQITFTPIRVVCNNTLSAALKNSKNKITIKHTRNLRDRLEITKQVLGLVNTQVNTLAQIWDNWSTAPISDEDSLKIMELVLGLPRDEKNELSTRASNILHSVNTYYHSGVGQEDIVGSKWGVYNAVTGYFQNVKDYKTLDNKFSSIFLSSDERIRQDLFNTLLTY